MRLDMYEDKRRGFIMQLEDAIKKGVIDSLKNQSDALPTVR